MARKTSVPQSQAPYRPGRVSTATNTEHNLRDKSPVGYKNDSDAEKESPPTTQSSEGDGIWWEVKQITAERRRKGKREYRVEYEGINLETGEPWPQEWKPWNWVTNALVEDWETRKAKNKKRRRASSSASPASPVPQAQAEVGACKSVRISDQDIKRYRNGQKRRKTTKENPIVISSSEGEEEAARLTPGNQSPDPVQEEQGEGDLGVEIEEISEDDAEPRVTKSRHRQIVESSQSGENISQVCANGQDSQPPSEKLVAVEILVRHDLGSSLYSSFHQPSSPSNEREDDEPQVLPSIHSLGEEPGEDLVEEGESPPEITVFGRSDKVHIQVAHTQSSFKGRREIPDSQSSEATSIHLTPADQRPVPETPLHGQPTAAPSSVGQFLSAREIDPTRPVSGPSSPQLNVDDAFESIPDSSNRVFSQDVRELTARSQSQSQSSKDSQASRVSLPSAQLSFGKIGVTPSFQSFPDSGEVKAIYDVEQKPGGGSNLRSAGEPQPVVLAGKSVADEASSFTRPDPPSQSQTPYTNLEPLTATNIPRRTQQSASTTDKDSFVTPTSFPEGSIDDALELATAPEHPFEPLASHRHNTIRILQEAVESRPEDIVDSDLETPIQPAQLENSPSHDQGQGEVAGLSNLPQLRNQESSELLAAGLIPDLLHPSPSVLSPRTPVQEEDPLQGGRSASSTPCGPIPASARPTPVTVLGYLQSQRSVQKALEGSEDLSSDGIVKSGTALDYAGREDPQGKELLLPSGTAVLDEQKQSNTSSNREAMSAGPVSPLLSVVDIAVAPEHRPSPQRQVVSTRSSNLLPQASPEPLSDSKESPSGAASGNKVADTREETPVTESPPIIDDEYLAASQALRLLRESPRSALNEVFLAIPLTENQQRIYQETILDRYRDVEAFYGIKNTQSQGGDINLGTIENIVYDLDRVSNHWELSEGRKYTSQDEGPKLVKWFRKQSSKFDFLFRLLKKLRDQSYSVALVLETGLLMDYADIFFRSAGYQFTRFSAESGAEVITPTPETQKLRLFLVPSSDMAKGISMPSANLVIAMDSSLDSSCQHIHQLRNTGPSQAPILHLIPINTIAHIREYLPDSSNASTRSVIRDFLNPVLYAAILVRDHAGILPRNIQSHLDALSEADVFSWLEELRVTENNFLPPLPLKFQNTQIEPPVSQTAVLSTSPARKRILSQSIAPSTADAKHKRQRIDMEQTLPGCSQDTPMLDSDSAPVEPGSVLGDPVTGLEAKIIPPSNASDATTHVTSTIPPEIVKPVEEQSATVGTPDRSMITADQGPAPVASEEKTNEPILEEETEEELLNGLTRDEAISLLRQYMEALWESKVRFDEFERDVSNREVDYQEQRDKVIGLNQTIRWQASQIQTLMAQKEKAQKTADQAIRDRDQARGEVQRFIKALKDTEQGESERMKIISQNAELKERLSELERKQQSAAKDAEFVREQYQKASQGTSVLMAEKGQLEEQVEVLTRRSDGVKVQLKEMNMDRERSRYQRRISEMNAKLDRAHKQIASLEVEKKRVERTRGVQTRASSIPPRGAQSSPVPTRPGSPSTTTHRSLRNSESA
ncbi:hypothetical protein TWF481_011238 [Arthrobotrys musiformis]|uniref:Chromo domain-containing protein n=1 Tax=Arthrobotrys musiformis TaxID=47236 RepID=A0AAV9VXP4_9PEZI